MHVLQHLGSFTYWFIIHLNMHFYRHCKRNSYKHCHLVRNFRLILAQRLINHTFWCLFTQRVAPLQAQVADKHVEGTSQVFFYLEGLYHLCCLQGRSESQQLPAKFTRISRSPWHAPSFFLTYAAHGVLLCPGCLCETFGCEWSLFGGSILDGKNFMKFHLKPSNSRTNLTRLGNKTIFNKDHKTRGWNIPSTLDDLMLSWACHQMAPNTLHSLTRTAPPGGVEYNLSTRHSDFHKTEFFLQ